MFGSNCELKARRKFSSIGRFILIAVIGMCRRMVIRGIAAVWASATERITRAKSGHSPQPRTGDESRASARFYVSAKRFPNRQ